MHHRYNPTSVVRGRRANDDIGRPIASALPLGHAHVATIDESHQRCAALGLSRIEAPDLSQLGRGELTVARDRTLRLTTHAAPVMEMLYEQIVNSESMVVLCDATGTILHSIGDDDFLERANKVALAPGVNWSEGKKGTNAIGTALIDEVPTLVHADEHFMHANHFLTCSAAPILDPRGNILGVLDVTGDQRSYHQHTMALVKMSARMIENHWLSESYRNVMRLHLHTRAEFIGTLMEGILAISPDGKIVGANRGALDLLGSSGATLRMHTLTSLLGTTVERLVDQFRSPLALPQPLTSHQGQTFHVHARFNWPVWHNIAEAAGALPALAAAPARAAATAPAAPAAAAAPARAERATDGAGLSALCSGDAQVESLVAKLRRVSDRDIPIVIVGETGTGKQTLARALHHDSARAAQPFVAVNCAVLAPGLTEADLFGRSPAGTLFLHEVGDLPLALQAQLLRLLQRGGAAAPAIVCATRGNLRQMIAAQTFREDLYYRLNGLAVRLPALRERTDVLAIAARLLARECPQRTPPQLAPDVRQLFTAFAWPGNLRQLFNVLRAACVMAGSEPLITREHLPDDFIDDAQRSARASGPAEPERSLEAVEIAAIRQAVDAAGGNISEASKRLGISRNTIYRKLRWK